MSLRELIESYIPADEQEKEDKEKILGYIDTFDDVLSRDNEVVNFVSSAWVMNKSRDKILMVNHDIYNSFMFTGGHAEGDPDLLNVALRETKEETLSQSVKPISPNIYMLDIFPVPEHIRKGKVVKPHYHLNTTFLFEADESEKLVPQEGENTEVRWIPINDALDYVSKEGMRRMIQKLIDKLEKERQANGSVH